MDASIIEKSLGKLLITVISLVISIGGCYKIQKREAFSFGDMPMVYLSLMVQVVARIVSFALAFFAMDNFRAWFPIQFMIHFTLVLLINLLFSKEPHIKGIQAKANTIMNTLASSLVYVRITPLEQEQHKETDMEMVPLRDPEQGLDPTENDNGGDAQRHNPTFLIQVLFFLLVLLENIFLAVYPLIKGAQNKALSCLGKDTICYFVLLAVALNMLSWILQWLHYKLMHPWQFINGPSIEGTTPSFTYYWCGKERNSIDGVSFKYSCCGKNQEFNRTFWGCMACFLCPFFCWSTGCVEFNYCCFGGRHECSSPINKCLSLGCIISIILGVGIGIICILLVLAELES